MASINQLEKSVEDFQENITIQFDADDLAVFKLFDALEPKIVKIIFSTVNSHKIIGRLKQRVEKQKAVLDDLKLAFKKEGINSDIASLFSKKLIPTSEFLHHLEKECFEIKNMIKETLEITNDPSLKSLLSILSKDVQEFYNEVLEFNKSFLKFMEELNQSVGEYKYEQNAQIPSLTEIMLLPLEDRRALLATSVADAKIHYLNDKDLNDFEAFGEDDLYD